MIRRRLRTLISAVLAGTSAIALLSLPADAGCNPHRSEGPAGQAWQAGAYRYSVGSWGVRADLEGYDPYLPNIAPGAASLATVMVADLESSGSNWIQPGIFKTKGTPQWPDGRHSAVQVWNAGGYQRTRLWEDLSSDPDPVPAIGEFRR
jgi:hypothetical protein